MYDDINKLELYVRSSYYFMVLILISPSLAFCVRNQTVMALDSDIRWYDERLTIFMYSLTPSLRRHGD
jgi:hypothetical protein